MMEFLEVKMLPVMSKVAEQKHLRAVRNGIVATIPVVIVGSIFLILINLPLEPLGVDWDAVLTSISPNLKTNLLLAFRLTVGLMALYSSFGIGVALGDEYDLDPTMSGLAAVIAFLFSVMPITVTGDMVAAMETAGLDPIAGGQYLSVASLGSGSLFGAIVFSLFAVEMIRLFKKYNITINMPDSVPPAVANSFANLFSIGFIILVVWIIRFVFGFDLNAFIAKLLSPLAGFLTGDNVFGVLLIVLLVTLFWSFGLHGVSLVGTVVRPFWEQAINTNMDIFAATKSAALGQSILLDGAQVSMATYPEQFLQWYVWIGGSGATIGICILMVTMAKSAFLKQMGKITIVPAIFNINEPVIFGLPIVMNPVLIIPFITAPMVMTIVAAILQKILNVNAMVYRAPWTLPGPIGAWMSTNWDFGGLIIGIVGIVISVVIYFPFFKTYDKQLLAEENAVE